MEKFNELQKLYEMFAMLSAYETQLKEFYHQFTAPTDTNNELAIIARRKKRMARHIDKLAAEIKDDALAQEASFEAMRDYLLSPDKTTVAPINAPEVLRERLAQLKVVK